MRSLMPGPIDLKFSGAILGITGLLARGLLEMCMILSEALFFVRAIPFEILRRGGWNGKKKLKIKNTFRFGWVGFFTEMACSDFQ